MTEIVHRDIPGRQDGDLVVFLHGRGLGPETALHVTAGFPGARIVAPVGGIERHRGRTWVENEQIGVAQSQSVAIADARFLDWHETGPLGGRHGCAASVTGVPSQANF